MVIFIALVVLITSCKKDKQLTSNTTNNFRVGDLTNCLYQRIDGATKQLDLDMDGMKDIEIFRKYTQSPGGYSVYYSIVSLNDSFSFSSQNKTYYNTYTIDTFYQPARYFLPPQMDTIIYYNDYVWKDSITSKDIIRNSSNENTVVTVAFGSQIDKLTQWQNVKSEIEASWSNYPQKVEDSTKIVYYNSKSMYSFLSKTSKISYIPVKYTKGSSVKFGWIALLDSGYVIDCAFQK